MIINQDQTEELWKILSGIKERLPRSTKNFTMLFSKAGKPIVYCYQGRFEDLKNRKEEFPLAKFAGQLVKAAIGIHGEVKSEDKFVFAAVKIETKDIIITEVMNGTFLCIVTDSRPTEMETIAMHVKISSLIEKKTEEIRKVLKNC